MTAIARPGLSGEEHGAQPFWADRLQDFGDRIALVTEQGDTLSHAELASRADAFAARLGEERRLVALGVRNDIDSIVAYLGCLRGRHPVLLLEAGGLPPAILQRFAPDAIFDAASGRLELAGAPQGGLHADLAVLLSTSGSTGSPKLVRLSRQAIASNTASICAYLDIGPDERAITTLPFHYSYGMSVLNTHLMAGASLALTDLSVTHPDFERFLTRARPTSLAGVPYTHKLLLRSGLVHRLPDSVRTLTQAGGRLDPERVLEMAAIGGERGFRFVTMYGQTEAAPRMAWLPPEQLAAHPDCIGRPVPGGRFELVDDDGQVIGASGVAGELVYFGANVMMGYGMARADLARGPELDSLHTGDIAERTADGFYRIVGRASRFAKIAGLRIGFDDVEALCRAAGIEAVATGTDRLLVLQVESADPDEVGKLVAAQAHVPEAVVAVVRGAVPRLGNGKVDYGAIRKAGEALAATREAALSAGIHPILAGYRRAFNLPDLGPGDSFQSLGGDSLAYVNVAIAIEKALGELPPRWEEMPVAALVDLARQRPAAAVRASGTTELSSEMLLRVVALSLVIFSHGTGLRDNLLQGGANFLMLLAGYNFARFQRTAFEQGRWWPPLKGSLERLVLPYYVMMLPLLWFSNTERSWGWYAMVSTYTVDYRGPLYSFWFIEAVFHALLVVILFYAFPAVRRLSARRPEAFGLLLVGFALVMKVVVNRYIYDDPSPISITVDATFWLYALGFLALVARGARMKVLLMAILFAVALLNYGDESSRPWVVLAGSALLLFVPRLRLPSPVVGPILRFAAASYFIYIIHVPLYHIIFFVLHIDNQWVSVPLLYVGSMACGLVYEMVWSRGMLWLKARIPHHR